MHNGPSTVAHSVHPVIDDCWNKIGVRGDASCPQLQQHVHCRNCPIHSAAAVQLLDRDVPADHLANWTSHFAHAKQIEKIETYSAIIFRIADEWLALATAVFEEVAEQRVIHSLPHRRGGIVLGVANVRGELLICVSLGKLLGLGEAIVLKQESHTNVHKRLLVISRESQRLAFPVDEVHGIHRSYPDEFKAVPMTVAKAAVAYTKVMLPWQDKTVGCLDDQLLFYTLNRSLT